jgi:hypothetical protein
MYAGLFSAEPPRQIEDMFFFFFSSVNPGIGNYMTYVIPGDDGSQAEVQSMKYLRKQWRY